MVYTFAKNIQYLLFFANVYLQLFMYLQCKFTFHTMKRNNFPDLAFLFLFSKLNLFGALSFTIFSIN